MAEAEAEHDFRGIDAVVAAFLCAYKDLHSECQKLVEEAQTIRNNGPSKQWQSAQHKEMRIVTPVGPSDVKVEFSPLIPTPFAGVGIQASRSTRPYGSSQHAAIPKPVSMCHPLDQMELEPLVVADGEPARPKARMSQFSLESDTPQVRKTAVIGRFSVHSVETGCKSVASTPSEKCKSHTFKRLLSQTLKNEPLETETFGSSMKARCDRCRERFSAWFPTYEDVVTRVVEPIMGTFIILNCILTGFSLDTSEWSGWRFVDWFFAVLYSFEIIVKISLLGCRAMYCGPSGAWSIFDTVILFLAWLDVLLQFSGAVTVFRILRFARLVRLLRLLRLPIMNELMLLIRGMVGGARCLFSCLFFLSLLDFIVSMVLSQVLRDWGEDRLFGSVPMAMFTTFRCMVGDCTDGKGRPIFLLVAKSRGGHFAFWYAIFILVIFFGVFNLITAIFIESTMQAAKSDITMQRQVRHAENKKFARNIKSLVYHIYMEHANNERRVGQRLAIRNSSETFTNFKLSHAMELKIDQDSYQELVSKPSVREVMDDLGLDDDAIADLFSTLDADGNGSLDMTELVNGLHKLRGDPSKRDLVALTYMMYSVQDGIHALHKRIDSLGKDSLCQAQSPYQSSSDPLAKRPGLDPIEEPNSESPRFVRDWTP